MVPRLCFIRARSLPFSLFSPSIHFFVHKPSPSPKTLPVRLFSSFAIDPSHSLSCGPSLLKGKNPLIGGRTDTRRGKDGGSEACVLDEDDFVRVFEISAIRVPARDCFALESRFHEHLLNWPRIPNIIRVPGDEEDNDVVKLPENKTEEENVERKKSKSKRKTEKRGHTEFTVVEMTDDGVEAEMEKSPEGSHGRREKRKGSTRVLLMDEKFTGNGVQELPEAMKNLFMEAERNKASSIMELVKCKLTLFYDYWPMNLILEAVLPKGMIVPSAFETIGHIAHLNLKEEHQPYKRVIAKVILDKNRSTIQTVVNKMDAINNDYRTMQLEVLAGNPSLVAMVIENGLRFHVDLERVYWNSKLGTERQRLLLGFNHDDVVCDVFAGVGPIAISASRIVKHVYANDLNPQAVKYMKHNSVLNKLEKKIDIFNMDGRRFIKTMFSSKKAGKITQVVMNLPNNASEYLDVFQGIYSDKPKDEECSLPNIHVYGFSRAANPESDFKERIRMAMCEGALDVQIRKVRVVAPGKWMLCASFLLPKSVAFSANAELEA